VNSIHGVSIEAGGLGQALPFSGQELGLTVQEQQPERSSGLTGWW
jgi:hypothetical protein